MLLLVTRIRYAGLFHLRFRQFALMEQLDILIAIDIAFSQAANDFRQEAYGYVPLP